MHADHITGTGYLKKLLPNVESVISRASGAKADIHLNDEDLIEFGRHQIKAVSTPGHTNGCMSFINFEQVHTGSKYLLFFVYHLQIQLFGSVVFVDNSGSIRLLLLPPQHIILIEKFFILLAKQI